VLPPLIAIAAKYLMLGLALALLPVLIGFFLLPIYRILDIGLTPFFSIGRDEVVLNSRSVYELIHLPHFSSPWLLTIGQWVSLSTLHMLIVHYFKIQRIARSAFIFVLVVALSTSTLLSAFKVPTMSMRQIKN